MHKQFIQIIQVAATPLQRGVEGERTVGEGGKIWRRKLGETSEHYCTRPSSGETGSVSWPLRCLCSVLFVLPGLSRSPVSLSLSRSLSLFLSLRPSAFSLSLRLLRFLRSLRSFFLSFRAPGNERNRSISKTGYFKKALSEYFHTPILSIV